MHIATTCLTVDAHPTRDGMKTLLRRLSAQHSLMSIVAPVRHGNLPRGRHEPELDEYLAEGTRRARSGAPWPARRRRRAPMRPYGPSTRGRSCLPASSRAHRPKDAGAASWRAFRSRPAKVAGRRDRPWWRVPVAFVRSASAPRRTIVKVSGSTSSPIIEFFRAGDRRHRGANLLRRSDSVTVRKPSGALTGPRHRAPSLSSRSLVAQARHFPSAVIAGASRGESELAWAYRNATPARFLPVDAMTA
jgi:hypothetical protein